MVRQKQDLLQEKSVIEQLLEVHEMSYNELAEALEIKPETLRRYRRGERDFRLSMSQIKLINNLLEPLKIKIYDLPDDWILEKKK